MLPWIIGGAIIAGAAALAWWLSNRQARKGHGGGGGAGGGSPGADASSDQSDPWGDDDSDSGKDSWWEKEQRRQLDAERRAKEQREAERIRRVLEGDEQVAELLLQQAGLTSATPSRAAQDDEMIRRIARTVDEQELNVLSSASRTNLQTDDINLQVSDQLKPVGYPADVFEVAPMSDVAEIANVLPEELAHDDEIFYQLLQEDSLHVIRHFEQQRKVRRLYILLDVSGSMREPMQGGGTRIQWAAGVALKLMLRAQAGEAEYQLRYFGNEPYKLFHVTNAAEAQSMADELLRLEDWNSGTDINGALQTAVLDIQSADTKVEMSDILLISDGESSLHEAWLRATFGGDIRLHVSMIGLHNPVLAASDISSSYEIYR